MKRFLILYLVGLFLTGTLHLSAQNQTNSGFQQTISYGDLVTDFSMGDQAVELIFSGTKNEKVRLGCSLFFSKLELHAPSGAVLYNQILETTPEQGLVLEFVLNESGTYLIRLTPQMGFLQYTLGLYLLEPVSTIPIVYNESYNASLKSWEQKTYRFQGTLGDQLALQLNGYTQDLSLYLLSPSGQKLENGQERSDFEINWNLTLNENGTYWLVLNSALASTIDYSLFLGVNNGPLVTVPYTPGSLLNQEAERMQPLHLVFQGQSGQVLRIGLELANAGLELYAPSGTRLLEIDHTDPFDFTPQVLEEVVLPENGEYRCTVWHNMQAQNSIPMRFCASFVPDPEVMKTDSVYHYLSPAFHRTPFSFNAEAGEVYRIKIPVLTTLHHPSGATTIPAMGALLKVTESGAYVFDITSVNDETVEFWVNKVNPPAQFTTLTLGEQFSEMLQFYETKSVQYQGIKADTVFLQANMLELVLNPSLSTLKPASAWLYLTDPLGKTSKIKGEPRGVMQQYGYAITYYFKQQLIFPVDGAYTFTLVMDKVVIRNPTMVNVRIDQSGERMEVPFNVESDYEMPGVYWCEVPEGLDELFVVVRKNNTIGYDATWRGLVSLGKDDQQWQSVASRDERDDFLFHLNQPGAGTYSLPVSANLDESIRGTILFTNQLPKAKLHQWNPGIVTRPYGSDWKTVDVPTGLDTLYFETEGFGLWSTLEVSYQQIANKNQRWTFQNMGEGYHIEGKIPHPLPGRYFLRYVDSAVLQEQAEGFYNHSPDQTKAYLLYVGAQQSKSGKLSIQSLSTHVVGRAEASIILEGTGFDQNQRVNLINQAETDTVFLSVYAVSPDRRSMDAGTDFSAVPEGHYYIEVASNDTLVRYAGQLEIIPVVNISIDGSMLTSDHYRLGRQQKCVINIMNNGTTDIPYAAGHLYSGHDKVNLLLTQNPYLWGDADSLNDMLSGMIFNYMPIFIQNLKVGANIQLVYNIQSTTIPDNEEFDVALTLGLLDEDAFRALQDSMATDCFNFMMNSETIPQSMKNYLTSLTLNGFCDLWSGEHPDALKSKAESQYDKIQRLENAMDKFQKHVDFIADKTLQTGNGIGDENSLVQILSNPYSAAKEGIKVIWDQAKKISNALNGLFNWGSKKEVKKKKKAVNSTTPEDKYGPTGYGLAHGNGYIAPTQRFEYRIDYWNKEDASAPAAIVYIRDTIDTDFDLKSLRFTEIGFLKWNLALDGGQYFNVNVDCRPDMPYIVNIEGTVDHQSREVFWVHTTLDPETMELPDDPFSGYLPPIDSTGYQIGWVSYTIQPSASAGMDAVFENQAFVNFDGVGKWGPAPPYGPYTNLFDTEKPSSRVLYMEEYIRTCYFDVELEGTDTGSGIDHFDVYVSKDYGPFELWQTTSETNLFYACDDMGVTHYHFYVIATDKVGNVEDPKTLAEAGTEVYIDVRNKTFKTGHEQIKVYPNPGKGLFSIYLNGSPCMHPVTVYSSIGNKILNIDTARSAGKLDLSSLTPGIYLLQLTDFEPPVRTHISIVP
ncbi:MAG: T9SS type A sorting domain-containing protein [Prolixibacteraceae bacterium]|nr:T9SS type A sorting domain-containing protein [Prolixibacteraceae bacterium]